MNKPEETLEEKKLRLEVEQLKLKWWQRSDYMAAFSPIVVALIAFLSALLSGWFDLQSLKVTQQIKEIQNFKNDLQTNLNTESSNILNTSVRKKIQIQNKTTPEAANVSPWLVVFSTDPSLSIDEPVSAEFEVKIARDKLSFQEVVILQRDTLFSTAIMFNNKEDAKKELDNIKNKLNRHSAFIISLEKFCNPPREEKDTSIRDGTKYPYRLYKCHSSN